MRLAQGMQISPLFFEKPRIRISTCWAEGLGRVTSESSRAFALTVGIVCDSAGKATRRVDSSALSRYGMRGK